MRYNDSCTTDDVVPETVNEQEEDGDSETEDEVPVMDHIEVDLNAVPQMLGEALTPFLQSVEEENVNRALTEQKIYDEEDNAIDPDVVTYMEAPTPEFENATAWTAAPETNLWMPHAVSVPTN